MAGMRYFYIAAPLSKIIFADCAAKKSPHRLGGDYKTKFEWHSFLFAPFGIEGQGRRFNAALKSPWEFWRGRPEYSEGRIFANFARFRAFVFQARLPGAEEGLKLFNGIG